MSLPTPGTPLTFETLQAVTSSTAKYEAFGNPEAILRSGLIEEIDEYLTDQSTDDEPDIFHTRGEIGDIAWYTSEISRFTGVKPDVIAAEQSLDDFQQNPEGRRKLSPVFGPTGTPLDFRRNGEGAIAVYALRVVDVLNPKNSELWQPDGERVPLTQALGDLMICAALEANHHGVSVNDAAWQTYLKLDTRIRTTHVLNEAAHKQRAISSVRERLHGNRWVRQLFAKTVLGNAQEIIASEPAIDTLP